MYGPGAETVYLALAILLLRQYFLECCCTYGKVSLVSLQPKAGSDVFKAKPDDVWVPRTHTVGGDQTPSNCPLNSIGVPQCTCVHA